MCKTFTFAGKCAISELIYYAEFYQLLRNDGGNTA